MSTHNSSNLAIISKTYLELGPVQTQSWACFPNPSQILTVFGPSTIQLIIGLVRRFRLLQKLLSMSRLIYCTGTLIIQNTYIQDPDTGLKHTKSDWYWIVLKPSPADWIPCLVAKWHYQNFPSNIQTFCSVWIQLRFQLRGIITYVLQAEWSGLGIKSPNI